MQTFTSPALQLLRRPDQRSCGAYELHESGTNPAWLGAFAASDRQWQALDSTEGEGEDKSIGAAAQSPGAGGAKPGWVSN
jgi:hypothetical protein